jgi:preprotein translocase subunit YajC
MNLLLAEAAAAPKGFFQQYGGIFMIIAIFAIFYFLLIRPQQKRQKELQRQIQQLKKGDKIVTVGGIRGTVLEIRDEALLVDSSGTKVEVLKAYVAQVIK